MTWLYGPEVKVFPSGKWGCVPWCAFHPFIAWVHPVTIVPGNPVAIALCKGERGLRLSLHKGKTRAACLLRGCLHSQKSRILTPSLLTASTLQVHPSSLGSDIHPHFSWGKWETLPATPCFQAAVLSQMKSKIHGIRSRWNTEQLYSLSCGACLAGAHPSYAALAFLTILLKGGTNRGMQGCHSHLTWCRRVKGNVSADPALLPSFPRAGAPAMHTMKWWYGLCSCAKCCVTRRWKSPNPPSVNKGNGEVIYCKINENAIHLKRKMHRSYFGVWERSARHKGE